MFLHRFGVIVVINNRPDFVLRPHFIDKPPGISRLRGLPRSAGISREQNLHRDSIVRRLACGQAWLRYVTATSLRTEILAESVDKPAQAQKNIPLIPNDLHKFANAQWLEISQKRVSHVKGSERLGITAPNIKRSPTMM